jgi:hypothetical protein
VQPITSTANALFEKIRNDEPFVLGDDSVGGSGWAGSVTDPNAPAGSGALPATDGTEIVAPDAEATAAPDAPATDVPVDTAAPEVLDGLRGQSAAQQTCSQPFGGG